MWEILLSFGYAGDFNILRKYRMIFLGILFAPLYKLYLVKHSSYIPIQAKLKGTIKFPHLNGIFIACYSEIGNGCTIYQQVTIGSNHSVGSKNIGAPKIGDNCLIGAGAKIIGGITIGNNVKIGAGCIITENIPDDCIVVMPKPRIILRQND